MTKTHHGCYALGYVYPPDHRRHKSSSIGAKLQHARKRAQKQGITLEELIIKENWANTPKVVPKTEPKLSIFEKIKLMKQRGEI